MRNALALLLLFGMSAVASAQGGENIISDANTMSKSSPCENKYGEDSVETIKNLSMFNQYYQEREYVKAFPYWMYLYTNAPCVKERITKAGPYMLKKAMKDPMYKDRMSGLIDTVFQCYALYIDMFGKEAETRASWANDLGKLRPKQRAEALAMFNESVNTLGNSTYYKVPKNYIYIGVKSHTKDSMSLDDLILILDQVTPIIDANIAAGGKYLEKWKGTQDAVTKMMLPYLDCEKIIELKEPQFEANKENLAWLKSTVNLLEKGKCSKEDFYFQVSEQLYTLEPSSSAAIALAKASKSREQYSKAISYYSEALEGLEGDELYSAYIQMATISMKSSSFANARKYAREALKIKENSGEAYILIGDAYASSVNACSGSKLKGREVFWVAVDKYAKARSVDSTVEELATKRINKYSGYFPDTETAFFEGISDGQSYTVGCWIGETTTVRTIASN